MSIVFAIENRHDKSCGEPPAWAIAAREPGELRSYFENHHGEQWIASASPELFRLSGGDNGWKTISVMQPDYTVLISELAETGPNGFRGLMLNPEEVAWLTAVIKAVAPAVRPSPDALVPARRR